MYELHLGCCLDTLRSLGAGSAQMCVTSPPYFGLRDYGHDGQIGLEATPDAYVAKLVEVFREVRRVLRDDGTLWLNLGDSYAAGKSGRADTNPADLARRAAAYGTGTGDATGPTTFKQRPVPEGLKPKDLIGIPWRVAFALQADGWYLRQDIIWHKPNPMPESVRDRCTKAHEYLFLLSKSERYYFDAEAMQEPFAHPKMQDEAKRRKAAGELKNGYYMRESGRNDAESYTGGMGFASKATGRNRRSVWTVATKPYAGAHFATFPPALIEPCILAGSRIGDTVLDPFGGSGTTAQVAIRHDRRAVLCELNADYGTLIHERLSGGFA